MYKQHSNLFLFEKLLSSIELPKGAYEKAIERYEDIGAWFSREGSLLKDFDPHIFSQGSFRLGTATRPLNGGDEYDLDLSCKLRIGITKNSHSQKQLKSLIGQELEAYRKARGIKLELVSKHRCWRLDYQDQLSFHIDIVPCIPEDETLRTHIEASIAKSASAAWAKQASDTTVAITDDRRPEYPIISKNWKISNPEGYATWFEEKMEIKDGIVFEKFAKALVDDVPTFNKKLPLQKAVQLLKRHRDVFFQHKIDLKPASIILTTLAAYAYGGEIDLISALDNILSDMDRFVLPSKPKIPNPVDPDEDFADRWIAPESKNLNLERNFSHWLEQAKSDFKTLITTTSSDMMVELARSRFCIIINELEIKQELFKQGVLNPPITAPRLEIINTKQALQPWKRMS